MIPRGDAIVSVKHMDEFARVPVDAGNATERQVLIGPDQNANFAMRRFIMQPGGGMPLHTNTVEHEQFVLRGRARIVIGEKTHEVKAGDVVYIPAGTAHSYAVFSSDEPFEFLCVVPNNPPDKVSIVEC